MWNVLDSLEHFHNFKETGNVLVVKKLLSKKSKPSEYF